MGLTAQLTSQLDSSHLGATLLSSISGPAANLNAVTAPAPAARLQLISSSSSSINPANVAGALAAVAERALPILASLPDAQSVLGTLNTVVQQIETLTQ